MSDTAGIGAADRERLRRLAERKAAIAADPVNAERREAWYRLDAGAPDRRPMVLAEVGGIRDAQRPFDDSALTCTDPAARHLERGLRAEIWQFEVLRDDHVVEPFINVGWQVTTTDYGVKKINHQTTSDVRMGAVKWEPALADLDADFHKLRHREFAVDRDATWAEVERLDAIFGDLLKVRIRRSYWWTLGMTIQAIDLIGLENLMVVMFDNPKGLHRLMHFLHDDHLAFARWLEAENLLCLNNENDYIGSGSMGYSRELPVSTDGKVRMKDQWALLESQETVGVGPKQFGEFIFPYQESLARQFGKVYYGCCEPVHSRWDVLKQMTNLARVSVSPWCDETRMAAACADQIVYSRKPNPTLISTEHFDEAAIRDDLRRTLRAAAGCRLEIVMKDVHTLSEQPWRLARWVELARQTVGETAPAATV